MYNRYKKREYKQISKQKKPGLTYILNTNNGNNYTIGVTPDTNREQLSYDISRQDTNSKTGRISNLNYFFKQNLTKIVKAALDVDPNISTKFISIDVTGLIHVTDGSYNFNLIQDGCNVNIWIGNNSICEFTSTNTVLSKNTTTYSKRYNGDQYVPIRIQCGFTDDIDNHESIFQTLKLIFSMKRDDKTFRPAEIPFFTYVKPPLLLYCAFISENGTDLENDNFLCYSRFTIEDNEIVVNNHTDLHRFYSVIRKNLVSIVSTDFNYNEYNRTSYGKLSDTNIKFTEFFSDGAAPFSYYLFILDSDPRMGKTFQIKDDVSSDVYEMNVFGDNLSKSILKYSDNYHEKTGYYPNRDSISSGGVQDLDGTNCKEVCNLDENCNHYFTFTSEKKPKCVTGSTTPYYNRVVPTNGDHPIDPYSSTLHLRNYTLDIENERNCIGIKMNQNNSIQNTYNYSDGFKYSNYKINANSINEVRNLGPCNDPEYKEQANVAAKILFENAKYFKNGKFKETFKGQEYKKDKKDKKNKKDKKYTHAIADTQDGINSNLHNSIHYSNKMMEIHNKHDKLSEKIPDMNKLYQYMKDENKYDHNGDKLLHFRNSLQPDILKKRIMDNNELNNNTKLLLALGTVTGATLILFAILLAKD